MFRFLCQPSLRRVCALASGMALGEASTSAEEEKKNPFSFEFQFNEEEEMRKFECDDPWQRVKNVFFRNEYNLRSFEGDQLYTSVQPAFLVGILIGGSRVARNAQEQFTRSTRLQMWESVAAAKVRTLDTILYRCFKGGLIFGAKLAFVIGASLSVWGSLTAYRNHARFSDIPIAAFVGGAAYCINRGLVAMLAAGTIFSAMTIVLVVAGLPLLRIAKQRSIDDFYQELRASYWKQAVKNIRMERFVNDMAEQQGWLIIWPWRRWEALKWMEEEEKARALQIEVAKRIAEEREKAAAAVAAEQKSTVAKDVVEQKRSWYKFW